MSRTTDERLDACQGMRWKLLLVALPLAIAFTSGLFSILWDIRGDVQYTKGRVDVLVKDTPAAIRTISPSGGTTVASAKPYPKEQP